MLKQIAFKILAVVATSMIVTLAATSGTLSPQPLSLKGGVPPTVMFALSVEFPTANTAAYQGVNDYSTSGAAYLGYFDSAKCYSYDTGNQWFYPQSTTSNRLCSLGWSGNFLNWATMTGLDEFRYAMTGGNRYSDTSNTTVLERSFQSGQGGNSNFNTKTFTDTSGTTTTYPAGTSLTIVNQGQGVKMLVTPGAVNNDTINCTGPSVGGGGFGCANIARVNSGEIGACLTWSGTGAIGSPYKCTSFDSFNGVFATSTAVGSVASFSTGGSTTAVTCSSPNLNGQGNSFQCASLQLSNGHTGTCTTWDSTSNGTSAYPYNCQVFGTFSGGENVSVSGANTVSNQSMTYVGSQNSNVYSGCTVVVGNPTTTSCAAAGSAPSASCTAYTGNGSSGSPYTCSTFALGSSATYVSASAVGGSATKASNNKFYFRSYNINYKPQITSSVYFVSSYPVSASSSTYYYSNYSASFGTVATPYYVRVKVCDSGVGLESNCVQYGSSYKPTGVIQDNGAAMRFGVTSYFNANDIDNAVLRSKAKFVAPTNFAGSGTSAINPYMEWSPTDGTLFTSPANCADGTTAGSPTNCSVDTATTNSFIGSTANTGVINYVNKFGKASSGYKTYDDTGKLYYETLKYLRGTTPTTDFYNGAKVSNADGFPVITSWDNPQTTGWSCQKNYIIAMGDTHTWCDKRTPGDTHTGAGSAMCNAYTDGNGNSHVADFGSLAGDPLIDVAISTGNVGTWEGLAGLPTSNTGAGGASYNMAGLASWAASHDIVTGSATTSAKRTVRSYVIDVQENKDCGSQSQYWLASKYGIPDGYDNNGIWLTGNTNWSQSLGLGAGTCVSRGPSGYNNTTGGTYTWPKQLLRANDPAGMIASVQSAVASIAAQAGDEAALAQSSGSLDAGTGAYVYRAAYNSGGWKGDISALAIDTSGNFAAAAAWTASTLLPTPANRTILSWNPVTKAGFDFVNSGGSLPAGMSAAQMAFLNTTSGGIVDNLGTDRLDYLRGDQTRESYLPGTNTANSTTSYGWRSRTSAVASGIFVTTGGILGDFINSNPVFVGPPSFGYSFAGYKNFATAAAQSTRKPLVFVGGNDGMLHGFDASYTINATTGTPTVVLDNSNVQQSGREVVGFIPSAVYRKLSKLMDTNYSHTYFVDGSPVSADICANVCNGSSDWKSIVVGSTGAGAQSVFALDVTSATFNASKVLWEFDDSIDSDMGYSMSKPVVRKLNDGKWYVIFGNGYNNTDPDGASSSTGRAYLYLLEANGPATGQSWTLGVNYYKIELKSPNEPVSLAARLLSPNGLSSVVMVDANQDAVIDYAYAGDRKGNLWKIDLTDASPANWKSGFINGAGDPLPLFAATDSSSNVQQITTSLDVIRHPNGGVMLNFGTGSWMDTQDAIGPFTSTDSLYGIWDKMDGVTRVLRSDLQKQGVVAFVSIDGTGTVTGTCNAGDANCYSVQSSCAVNYSAVSVNSNTSNPLCPSTISHGNNQPQQYGWVMDFPGSGERTRSSAPLVNGSNITVQTLTPSSNPCTGNTIGMEYQVSALTGGQSALPVYILSNTGINTVTLGSTYFPTLGAGVTVAIAPSGHSVAGGASDNPIQFNIRPPSSLLTPPPGMPTPPTTACVGAGCPDYIPGWGFLMNLSGPTSAKSRYIYACHQPEFGSGAPVCTLQYKRGRFGQLNWKTINR